jgi:hypothetical protein
MSIQAWAIVAGGTALLVSTVALVRLRLLSIRYGLGWLSLSALAIAGAPVLVVLADHVDRLGLTPTGFSLGVLALFLGLICFQLSISLSGVQHVVQDLAEHAAHVEHRVRELERAAARADDQVGSERTS